MEVRVQNLRKEFGRFPALHDVSLDIRSSELIALLGDTGKFLGLYAVMFGAALIR